MGERIRLTKAEREALHSRLASWFGDDRQAFLVSDLAPVVEHIVADRLAEAEFHIKQLTEARDRDEAEVERLADRVTRAKAGAWDEGFTKAGRLLTGLDNEEWPPPPNPYRPASQPKTSAPNIGDTCCGKCPGGTCYVDQVTGA